MSNQLLDYEAAANRLSCSPRTVRKLVADGKLASVRVGALVRIEPQDLADYISASRRRASN